MKRLQVNTSFVWLFAIVAGLILSLGMIRSAGRKLSRPAQNSARTSVALLTLPHIILWAWERPEKLDFIEKDEAGIAFLAKTLYLRGERVVSRPRLQPLLVSPGVALVAVARIEPSASEPASLSSAQMESAAHEIAELAKLPNVVTVQVDFDARTSERAFYSELLIHVRQALPATMALSITALASWCKGDNWLDSLPINEAIPMLFRMGIDRSRIVSGLASGETFSSPLCRQSSGVSTDETLPYAPATERIYVFNPNPWSPNSFQKVLERYQR